MSQFGQYNSGNDRRVSGARPQFGEMTVGDYANGMPSIRVGAMFKSLLRQFLWVIPLFLVGTVAAFYVTKDIKRTYKGEGRLLVQIGSEYTFDPVTGQSSQGGGVLLTPDIITLNEAGIMKSQEVIQSVKTQIEQNNLQQAFAPKIYAEIAAANNPIAATKAQLKLHDLLEKSYEVEPQPKSSLVDLSFKHENGAVAVEITRFFMNAYMKQRQSIFVEGSVDVVADRRAATEEQLLLNEAEIQAFLRKNGISEFGTERTGATTRLENLRAEINTLTAQMTETEAALATVEAQLRNEAPEINLYVDDRAGQRVAQAELELKNLLSRYLPGSDPVMAKQAEIDQYKALQASKSGQAIGGRRVGPNPVYQALMTRRNLLQSTADSYREKEFALQRQLNVADAKVKRFQRLSPQYSALMREQDTLNQRHLGYTAKEQEALVNQRQSNADSENVRVISWPDLPRKGRNMRAIMTLLISVGWLATLLMIALLRVFLDPKLYNSRVQFGRRSVDGGGSAPTGPGPDQRRHTRVESYVPEPVPASAYNNPSPDAYSTPRQPAPQTPSPAPSYGQIPVTQSPPPYMPVPYVAGGAAPQPTGSVPVLGTVPPTQQG